MTSEIHSGADMSAEETRTFMDRADRFLAVANGLAGEVPLGQISASMMFSTARFNAFVAQAKGLEPGEVDEETVAYFCGEYEKMLRENLSQILSSRKVPKL
jgi:hypothetical protein